MKIIPSLVKLNSNHNRLNSKQNNIINNNSYIQRPLSLSYPKNYYLSFEARVDKDLDSFIKRNSSNLPDSVRYYVENLTPEQKQEITPLEAQRNAFEYIALCDSVDDVKEMYPSEPLFSNLISTSNTKATRGILFDIRYLKDTLAEENQTVLKTTDEDLSIYLVKKIFLEGKTIPEINEDLDKDINPILQKEDKNYILDSTLKALGIALPSVSYLNSLRYTKEGYSDMMASKLSQHWKDLSAEQKEKIINSHSSNFERKLSQEQKERLSKLTKERWEKMTPEQKVDLIDKLQQGNKEQKIVMISAWNKCPKLRKELSQYLYENNYFSPQNVIYNEKPLSEAMRIIMSRFWQNNQDGARELGNSIIAARSEFNQAKKLGQEEEYINQTLELQKENKAEIKNLKAKRPTKTTNIQNAKPKEKSLREKLYEEYKNDFSFFPDDCLDGQFKKLDEFSTDEVEKFMMFLKNEKMSDEDAEIAKKISEAICSKQTGQGSFRTEAFISSTCLTALTQALEPIVNPVTKEEYKVNFPLFSDSNAIFILTSRLCYYFSHNNVDEFNLVDWMKTQNNMDEILNSPLDDTYGLKLIEQNSKNPSKVKEVLGNYKYKFKTIPDVQTFKDTYNMNILNSKDDYVSTVKKRLIKLAGYKNLKEKDFKEIDEILNKNIAYIIYQFCFSQENIPAFSLINSLVSFSNAAKARGYDVRIFKTAVLTILQKEFEKLDKACAY